MYRVTWQTVYYRHTVPTMCFRLLWTHQFLQAFFLPLSLQLTLREAGSGFFKSSSSSRASESTRSYREEDRDSVNILHKEIDLRGDVLYLKNQTHHIIITHVVGWQRPHFDSVGIQSRFLCWKTANCLIQNSSGRVRSNEHAGRVKLPGLGVFFPNDSLIWLDDPTSKFGLDADTRTLDRVFPW